MIRRDVPLSSAPTHWLLVSQIEHARLSAQLSIAWRAERSPASENSVRAELLAAIAHHDDGWAAWEANPSINPRLGQPYSFLELPRDESLIIWRDSIEICRRIGPLAGWVVAGHFVQLLRDSSDADTAIARAWLTEIESLQEAWLADWIRIDSQAHSLALADDCLFHLRLFDWLSLWLCCQCPALRSDTIAEPMIVNEGPYHDTPLHFQPTGEPSASAAGAPRTMHAPRKVLVTPWPFTEPTVELDALGYAVPAKDYATSEELAQRRLPQRLRWRLVPE